MNWIKGLFVCAAIIVGLNVPADADDKEADKKIVIDGSTTVGPIAKAFASYYKKKNPDVKINISETGSGNGAKSLVNNGCDIAIMSRFMKKSEFKTAVEKGIVPMPHVVAMDGIAVVLHPSNPVKQLTLSQLSAIYSGKVKNWKDVGGPNKKIVKISRDTSSGTYEVFSKIVLKEKKMKDVEYVASNGAARARVSKTPAAIAYVGMAYLEGVKPIKVNGVEPTTSNIGTGRYPLARPLFMWTNGFPEIGSEVYSYIMLHSTKIGKKIISELHFVPIGE